VSEVDKSCGTQQNCISIKVLLFPLHTFLTLSSLINHAKFLSERYPLSILQAVTQVRKFVRLYNQYKVSADYVHKEKSGLL